VRLIVIRLLARSIAIAPQGAAAHLFAFASDTLCRAGATIRKIAGYSARQRACTSTMRASICLGNATVVCRCDHGSLLSFNAFRGRAGVV